MTGITTEEQIKNLNSRIAELALIVSLKTKEMDSIEKKYADRLAVLNRYISQLQETLGIAPNDGTIADTDFLDKIQATCFTGNGDEDYVLIPTKKIVHNEKAAVQLDAKQPLYLTPKSTAAGRRKKITCSYCNEKGHKRSQCPKILYNQG